MATPCTHARTLHKSLRRIMLLTLLVIAGIAAVMTGLAGATSETTAGIASTRSALQEALLARTNAEHSLGRCRQSHAGRCAGHRATLRREDMRVSKLEARLRRWDAGLARSARTKPTAKPSASDLTAPTITVTGQTLSWPAVANVSSYVLVRKAPGQADQYSTITGTSTTPAAAPGLTARYSVRTNVSGSSWAKEVAISYPAALTTTSTTTSAGTTATSASSTASSAPETTTSTTTSTESSSAPTPPRSNPFEMGVVAGSALTYELPFIQKLGAHTARMEFEIDTPASQMAPIIEAYARAGIRPLLLASFYGTLPSTAEAANLASWASDFGPDGAVWKGKSFPAGTAVTDIEFGNETSYSYQYSEDTTADYATRAQTYAQRFSEAYSAVHSAEPAVGLLAQGDPGNAGPEWVHNMFKAVPDLAQMVAGWSVHPYGPKWESIMNEVLSTTEANGAPSSIPMYVTEWGLTTDNGRCLESNYGWNPCMTYAEAASTLTTTIAAMRARYGSELAAVYIYQAHDQAATGTTTSFGKYFGLLQSNGEAKGAYSPAAESLLSSNP